MGDLTWEFFGGIGTIGGTIIQLTSQKHRLIFDMGRIFNPSVPVFDGTIEARGIHDLQKIGIAPVIPGLFVDGSSVEADIKTLVAISHSHLDHTGLLPYLRHDIPVLLTDDTYRLLAALDEVLDGPKQPLQYHPVAYDTSFEFGPFRITVVPVDHDTPGASAFFIEVDGTRFVYSGDLRLHGAHPEVTEAFAKRAREFGPDVLWIEGTRALADTNEGMPGELELPQKLTETMADVQAGVFFTMYPRHPQRLDAFRAAANAVGRQLLVSAHNGYIYEKFGGSLEGCGIYAGGSADWTTTARSWVEKRGLPVVTPEEIREREGQYVVEFGYERFIDWLEMDLKPGGVYIHSNGSPLGTFDPAWNNMLYWLDKLGLELCLVGSTGHGSRGDIHHIIKTIHPRVLMPIHSLTPARIGLINIPRILPKYGYPYAAADLADAKCPTAAEFE